MDVVVHIERPRGVMPGVSKAVDLGADEYAVVLLECTDEYFVLVIDEDRNRVRIDIRCRNRGAVGRRDQAADAGRPAAKCDRPHGGCGSIAPEIADDDI